VIVVTMAYLENRRRSCPMRQLNGSAKRSAWQESAGTDCGTRMQLCTTRWELRWVRSKQVLVTRLQKWHETFTCIRSPWTHARPCKESKISWFDPNWLKMWNLQKPKGR